VEQHVSKLQVAVCMEDPALSPTGSPHRPHTRALSLYVTLLCSLCSKLKLDVPGLVETVTRPRLALADRAHRHAQLRLRRQTHVVEHLPVDPRSQFFMIL
jgi:hypothetical protein